MTIASLTRAFTQPRPVRSGRNHKRGTGRNKRLALEALDSRVVPAVFNVTTGADVLGGSHLSLRQAILKSNMTAGPNTINLGAGVYKLTRFGSAHDGTNGALQITNQNVTIHGMGAGATVIDGGGVDRVFDIEGALNVAFNGVTIQHGMANDNSNAGNDPNGSNADGGGIYSPLANLRLTNTVIANNLAYDAGGGIWTDTGNITIIGSAVHDNNADSSGGGLFTNSGAIALNNTTFADNLADENGGGLTIERSASAGNLTIIGCKFLRNTADDEGGAISDFSSVNTVSITGTKIVDNIADSSGGGLLVEAAKVTIDQSTISNNTSDGSGGGIQDAFNANQVLRITHSTVDGNIADSDGGGIESNAASATFAFDSFSNNVAEDGAGIGFFGAELALTNSHVDGNRAESSEGGMELFTQVNGSSCTIDNSTLNNNRAANSEGGALIECITLTVSNSSINGNRSGSSVGGLESFSTTATFTNVNVVGNTAGSSYGGLYLADTSLTLAGCTVSNNRSGSSVGGLYVNGATSISHTTISGNRAGGSIGGLALEGAQGNLLNDTISNNTAASGVGGVLVFVTNGGTINNSTISGNRSAGNAGGIQTELLAGTLMITGCNISKNHAGLDGGGLFDDGSGTVSLTNDTVFENTAEIDGGGIYHETTGKLNLQNVTIDGNAAANGGGVFSPTATVYVHNSIIAGNKANPGHGPDVAGGFTTQGFNLIGVEDDDNGFENGVNSDQVGTVAKPKIARLGLLLNHGGATFTQKLLHGSPAIDHGDNTGAPATDQRGTARPRDGDGNGSQIIDIGAFER